VYGRSACSAPWPATKEWELTIRSPSLRSSRPAASAPAPRATLADVAWLQGYWVGEGLGGILEDVWMPPKAGVMLGAFRLEKKDGTRGFYELFAIEEVEGTLEFVVKHFHPDWVGCEEKDKAFRVRLSKVSAGEAVFGRIEFERKAADALEVRLAIRSRDGTVRHEVLSFRRRAL
jgi:hypothetical protein